MEKILTITDIVIYDKHSLTRSFVLMRKMEQNPFCADFSYHKRGLNIEVTREIRNKTVASITKWLSLIFEKIPLLNELH